MGYALFTIALCCCTFSILCYFLSSELRRDECEKGVKELTIVETKEGKAYSIDEYRKILEKDEFDIKPNTTYHKVLDKLRKDIKATPLNGDSDRYETILDVFESDQYRVQKRVVISSKTLEECIDYWPEAFDGIECLIDDNGNGIPDEA